MWRRAGGEFGIGHSLNEERKRDPTVEDEWRLEHEDTADYGGEDGRLWRSVEMRARDTTNYGGEDAQLWRRREGKMGKGGLRRGENRKKEMGKTGKWVEKGRQ